MKRWIKVAGLVILIPIVLFVLVAVLLYIPSVQNYAKNKATAALSKATGMDIRIDRVRLSFPLNLAIRDVEVVSASADTLLHAGEINASVRLLPLFKKQVVVNGADIKNVAVDSDSLIKGMKVKGAVGSLSLKADRALLTEEQVTVNDLTLSDSDIYLCLNDTSPTVKDTVQSPVQWKFDLESVALDNVAFALDMPLDSLRLSARVDKALLKDGNVDLDRRRYAASEVKFTGSSLAYSKGDTTALPGFDPSHIVLSDLDIELDSVSNRQLELTAVIRKLSFKERSGLEVTQAEGEIRMDSTQLYVPGLSVTTPNSKITLEAEGAVSSFGANPEGTLKAQVKASVGKKDVLIFASALPDDFKREYPDRPLTVNIDIDGNARKLYIRALDARLPDALRLTGRGNAENLNDSIRRSGELKFDLETGNLGFALALLDSAARKQFALPPSMQLKGEATVAQGLYRARLNLTEGKGEIDLTASYRHPQQQYNADLEIRNFPIQDFVPADSLRNLTASVQADGTGTDFFSPATAATVKGKISELTYDTLRLTGITLDASLKRNRIQASLNSTFAPAAFDLALSGLLKRNQVTAKADLDAKNIDLYRLHLMQVPFATSFALRFTGESDMKKAFEADATLSRWHIVTSQQSVNPKDIVLKALSAANETRVSVQAGDLELHIDGNEDVQTLGNTFSRLSAALSEQLKQEAFNLERLQSLMPQLQLRLTAGQDNPVHNFLGMKGISFKTLTFGATTSPAQGLNGNLLLNTLYVDTLQLDTVRLALRQETRGIALDGAIINNEQNRQHVFTSTVDGLISDAGAEAMLKFVNGQGKTGLLLGVRVKRADHAWNASFYPDDPILAFRRYRLVPDNYIRLYDNKKIEASFRMEGEDGSILSFNSKPSGAKQNILDLGIEKFNLSLLSQLVPYMPEVGGLLHAEVQYAALDSTYHIKAGLGIDTLSYERRRLGDIELDASYMPGSDKSHNIRARMLHNKKEVLTAAGTYTQSGGGDDLKSQVKLTSLPLWIANAFVPDDMAVLHGAADGEVAITGHAAQPALNGYLRLDTASVFVVPAGAEFRFDDKRIEIKDNRFLFNRYDILSSGSQPFVIDGVVDASDFARIMADLTLTADNMEVLNVKRNKESLVYGKVYIDLNSTVKGPLDALVMRGGIDLLGNTNVTYVLKDSPLTVQDRLSGLVTFVNFADTAQLKKVQEEPLKLSGLDMLVTIHIDEAAQLNVDLSADRQSYANVAGGGDLSFQYTPQGAMILTGRYTINSGTVRYALPVIPAKTFTIKQGSYVEWTGPVADPFIDVTAIERVRTSVALNDGTPQTVNFDVSIAVKNTLENLSLKFDLSAPENMAMQNELSAMSAEQRGKQAITMLVTNMYIAEGQSTGKSNVNIGNALNGFLQKEIGNLAGSALKHVDITFGMENYDADGQPGGGNRTDYSFQFARKFYNDRIQVIVGGRISTGLPEEENQSFIDNVSVEYRLDSSGSRYIKVFHNKDYESILEGEITETGVGIVLRKKMQRLRELFLFKKKKEANQSSTL